MQPRPDDPVLSIDNSLSPSVAAALKDVGYRCVVQDDVPEFRSLPSVKDELHIIPWCGEHEAVWVHRDDNARTEHAKHIATAGVRTIWVYAPPGFKFSMREQLRALAFALPEILEDFAGEEPNWGHYEVRVRSDRRITIRGFIPPLDDR